MRRLDRSGGFSLLEVAISLSIFALLVTSVLSMTVETSSFLQDNDTNVSVQMEGNRAFQRVMDVLRKSGRMTEAGVTYPRVTAGGTRLEFRILADLDGNGYPYDATTGELEWNPTVFTLRADVAGDFGVFNGGTRAYSLGRFIQNLNFQTIAETPSLHLREIQVTFEARKATDDGYDIVQSVSGSIFMRN